jgi:hypothetical protein
VSQLGPGARRDVGVAPGQHLQQLALTRSKWSPSTRRARCSGSGAGAAAKSSTIMSAINVDLDFERREHPGGDRVRITQDGTFLPYAWD